MKLIKQPNNYSCMAASAAMLFHYSIEEIYSFVGHDGSQVIHTNLPDPLCFKGIHIQEIIDVADRLSYSMTPIEFEPWQTSDGVNEYKIQFPEERFWNHLKDNKGLLIGKAKTHWHVCAWSGQHVFDPAGLVYSFSDIKIDIQTFYKIKSF